MGLGDLVDVLDQQLVPDSIAGKLEAGKAATLAFNRRNAPGSLRKRFMGLLTGYQTLIGAAVAVPLGLGLMEAFTSAQNAVYIGTFGQLPHISRRSGSCRRGDQEFSRPRTPRQLARP